MLSLGNIRARAPANLRALEWKKRRAATEAEGRAIGAKKRGRSPCGSLLGDPDNEVGTGVVFALFDECVGLPPASCRIFVAGPGGVVISEPTDGANIRVFDGRSCGFAAVVPVFGGGRCDSPTFFVCPRVDWSGVSNPNFCVGADGPDAHACVAVEVAVLVQGFGEPPALLSCPDCCGKHALPFGVAQFAELATGFRQSEVSCCLDVVNEFSHVYCLSR